MSSDAQQLNYTRCTCKYVCAQCQFVWNKKETITMFLVGITRAHTAQAITQQSVTLTLACAPFRNESIRRWRGIWINWIRDSNRFVSATIIFFRQIDVDVTTRRTILCFPFDLNDLCWWNFSNQICHRIMLRWIMNWTAVATLCGVCELEFHSKSVGNV